MSVLFSVKRKEPEDLPRLPVRGPFPAGAGKARTTVLARRLTGSALCVRGAVRESLGYKLLIFAIARGFFFVLFLSVKKKNKDFLPFPKGGMVFFSP